MKEKKTNSVFQSPESSYLLSLHTPVSNIINSHGLITTSSIFPALLFTWALKMHISTASGYTALDLPKTEFTKMQNSSYFSYLSEWHHWVSMCSSLKQRCQSWLLFLPYSPINMKALSTLRLKYLLNPSTFSILSALLWFNPYAIPHRFLSSLLNGLPDSMLAPLQFVFQAAAKFLFL